MLLKCTKLREKYISAHPEPPQDNMPSPEFKTVMSTPSSPIKSVKNGKTHYRRRLDPEYDVFSRPVPVPLSGISYRMIKGVFNLYRSSTLPAEPTLLDLSSTAKFDKNLSDEVKERVVETQLYSYVSFEEFVSDFEYLRRIISTGPIKSYSFKRLKLLEARFKLHILLNDTRELEATKSVPHRDFYNVRKVL